MDPKQNPPLDPKLKEAYDRVMGFSVGDSSNSPQSSVAPVQTPTDSSTLASPIEPASTQGPEESTSESPILPPMPDPLAPSTTPVAPIVASDNPTLSLSDTPVTTTSSDVTAPIPNPLDTMPSPDALSTDSTINSPVLQQDALTTPTAAEPLPQPLSNPAEVPPAPLPTPDTSMPTSPSAPESLAATMPVAVHATETIHVGATSGEVKKTTKRGISPLVILFGGIVLLLAYVLFWVRVFNLPIPFISQ
ncbi:MAG TPA: hypothetical protein VN711_02505 [Candidatus Saccharimonadales bacterium]|nr:hypothetical protein [Candidatus Saccharimonadales bacterium]